MRLEVEKTNTQNFTTTNMGYTSPAVVIDNGSYSTKAGFAVDDIPALVFNTNYLKDSDGKIVVGDDAIANSPSNDVFTLMDNGLIYDFENIVHNWQYVYDNIDNNNSIDPKEFPLVLTEQSWNTPQNKLGTVQAVFEQFEVPVFSLVKTPLAQLFRAGRSTGLVVDIGSSVASVTPILDGIVQNKAALHSKYAGDFLNLHLLHHLQNQTQNIDVLLPAQFTSKDTASESFKSYYISHNALQEYKNLALNYQIQHFQLPNKLHIPVLGTLPTTQYLETLFNPNVHKLSVPIPEQSIDKPHTLGVTNLIFSSLKTLEAQLLPLTSHLQLSMHNKYARFNEIFKSVLLNVLITGGSSLVTGVADHVLNDLRHSIPKYFPNYTYSSYSIAPIISADSSEVWDRQFGSWRGACNLAGMLNDDSGEEGPTSANIALDNWFVTKAEYEELGEDLILEKFK